MIVRSFEPLEYLLLCNMFQPYLKTSFCPSLVGALRYHSASK